MAAAAFPMAPAIPPPPPSHCITESRSSSMSSAAARRVGLLRSSAYDANPSMAVGARPASSHAARIARRASTNWASSAWPWRE